jgi:hypothetical protein
MRHNLNEFDFVFLSFDEPNAELCYAKLLYHIPWAKRVHGVKGFDAAHCACADMSTSNFFVTVDGDNEIYPEFYNLSIDINEDQHDHAWTWAGRNHTNGLVYGNGGLKLWSKNFVYNMNSHERAANPEQSVDFCWKHGYHEMRGCYSVSYTNSSPQQSWRSGFREGVKMCLDRGRRVTIQDFKSRLWYGNIQRLCIWASVGQDVDNGIWAIYGARLGAWTAMLTKDDHSVINDYDLMKQLWYSVENRDPFYEAEKLGRDLKQKVGLDISLLSPDDSRFFKRVYMNPPRPWMPNDQIEHFMATRNV